MLTYFTDTETCGLTGPPVLLQYAINRGPVQIVHLWTTPIQEVLKLIEDIVDNRVVAHNIRFDWFMLSKFYNMLRQAPNKALTLIEYPINTVAQWEYEARNGLCLKPRAAVCTMLLAQKGEHQSFLMDAKPVWVRKVPVGLAQQLCDELEIRTDLPWILFDKRAAGRDAPKWKIADRTDEDTGETELAWKDLKLSFTPSNGLKPLNEFLCNHKPAARFDEIALPEELFPIEEGYAPYVALLSSPEQGWEYLGKKTWPALIQHHIDHWASDEKAMEYAVDDIVMLKNLYEFFGSPEDDQDGILACQVASVRLRGFPIDLDEVKSECAKSVAIVATARLNVDSPKQVKHFVAEALAPIEQMIVMKGCDAKIMDKMKLEYTKSETEECYCEGGKTEEGEVCLRCNGRGETGPTGPCLECTEGIDADDEKCSACDGTGLAGRAMPVIERVNHVEEIRKHKKRIQLFDKLILAKRLYPDFNVIGTKSGRMSGASGLNPQGIDKSKEVRSIFRLADPGWILSGGDYSSQELAIAATTMNDDDLMKDLESGKSLHGLFGAEMFQTTYEDIMNNKAEANSRYDRAKSAVYLMLYGGTFETMAKNSGVEVGICEKAYNAFIAKYPQMGSTRKAITDRFSSLRQDEDGKIAYRDPPEKFIASIYGFKRFFNTEYGIQKMILDVIRDMPQAWKDLKAKVCRNKEGKQQTLSGAICSALYGAAYSIQNKIIRASNNHVIQSTGRTITMGLQHAIWQHQPQGIHEYQLLVMSIHDEIAVASRPELVQPVSDTVLETVTMQCQRVPLIALEWGRYLKHWFHLKKADKKKGDDMVSCGWQEK